MGQSPSRTLELQTFRAFDETVETEPGAEWFVADMLAPGCWTELLGRMKEGKSTFAMGMIGALLEGSEFLGRATRQTKVLYLTEQAGRSFQATVRRGGLETRDDAYVLTIADTFGLPWAEVARQSVELAKQHECGVLVVDTLSGLAQIEDEDSASSLSYLNPLQGAKAAGIAVLFVRHSRKSGGAVNVAGRGSGAITGAMDICLRIDAPDGVASAYRSLEIISRLTGVMDAHLSYEGGTYILGPSPDAAKAAARINPVIAFLSSAGPGGATSEEVAKLIRADVRTARRRLTELVHEGKAIVCKDHADERIMRYALAPAVQ